MSLVFDHMGDLEAFVAHYKVPVAYFQDRSAVNNRSARLVPVSQCNTTDGASHAETAKYFYQDGLLTKETALCVLFRSEKPPNPPLYLRRAPAEQKHLKIFVQSIELRFNGKLIGSHKSLDVYRIPPILWQVGCVLPWGCFGLFSENAETIGSEPHPRRENLRRLKASITSFMAATSDVSEPGPKSWMLLTSTKPLTSISHVAISSSGSQQLNAQYFPKSARKAVRFPCRRMRPPDSHGHSLRSRRTP
jgi:hypothetical protein